MAVAHDVRGRKAFWATRLPQGGQAEPQALHCPPDGRLRYPRCLLDTDALRPGGSTSCGPTGRKQPSSLRPAVHPGGAGGAGPEAAPLETPHQEVHTVPSTLPGPSCKSTAGSHCRVHPSLTPSPAPRGMNHLSLSRLYFLVLKRAPIRLIILGTGKVASFFGLEGG